MLARISSFAFNGIDAVPVEVQVQIASGLPTFVILDKLQHISTPDGSDENLQ